MAIIIFYSLFQVALFPKHRSHHQRRLMIRARGCTRPLLWIRCLRLLLNLCYVFAGCFVSRDRRQILLPLRCTNSRPTTCVSLSKVTQHNLTSLPTHPTAATLNHVLIAHVTSRSARPPLTDFAGRILKSWLHRPLYGTEIQDCLSPPFGHVVVDGLNAGQLHHAVAYPLREHA